MIIELINFLIISIFFTFLIEPWVSAGDDKYENTGRTVYGVSWHMGSSH